MKPEKLEQREPAASIISRLGGISEVAAICQVSQTQVQRWRWTESNGGTGGFIPRKHHERLIEAAKRLGIVLVPGAFVDPALVPVAAAEAAA